MENTDFSQFKEAMRHRIIDFKYEKKDGTIREARGTKQLDLVPEDKLPKGSPIIQSDSVYRYFDIDKNSWRCFEINKFISFDEYIQ